MVLDTEGQLGVLSSNCDRPRFTRSRTRPQLRPPPRSVPRSWEALPHARSDLTRPLLIALALTGLGAGLAYWIIGMPPLLGAEDAAIGFRYARNLSDGHGIVFNPGGERVEGFTSMSWLFLSAGVYSLFGPSALEPVLAILSLAMTVFTLTIVLRLLHEEIPAGPGLWIGVVWLFGLAGFYFWSALSLMDVAPWGAGITAYTLLLHRALGEKPPPRGVLATVVVLLVLTRPESMLVVPAALLVAVLAYGPSRRLRAAAIEVLSSTALSVGALTAFRLAYFGVPLPNTYYVKVSPDALFRLRAGLTYLTDYLFAHPTAWLALVAAIGLLGARAVALLKRSDRAMYPLPTMAAGMIAVGFASVVYGGGDHYQGHRFLQAYLPLAALPLGAGLLWVQQQIALRRPGAAMPVMITILLVMAAGLPLDWTTFRDHDLRRQAYDVGLQGRFVGLTLNQAFEDGDPPELGLWMVGGAAYTYMGPVKDLLGLNWKAMGMSPGERKGPRDHAAFNLDVFWSAPPELMIPEPEAVLRGVRCVRSVLGGALHGLLTTPRFHAEFEPVRIRRADSEPLIAYARSDWLGAAPAVIEPLEWSYCNGGNGIG